MKKWLCFVLAGILLLLSLAGCSEKSNILSATAEYNGQTITMSYKVTDVIYPWDMRSIEMQQGYAVFYDYTWYKEYEESGVNPYPGDTWNILDKNGRRLLTEPYMHLTSFNKDGVTVAKKMDGSCVQLNTKLEETPITEQEYTDFWRNPENDTCSTEWSSCLSCVENGLAIYVEYKDKKAYAGLADQDRNVIIPAFIPIYYSEMIEHLHLSEGVAFVEDDATDNIGIISITRT